MEVSECEKADEDIGSQSPGKAQLLSDVSHESGQRSLIDVQALPFPSPPMFWMICLQRHLGKLVCEHSSIFLL